MQTSEPISSSQLLNQLHWRYAVKKFDPARTIPDPLWNTLEQALVLTPSSFGMQPWKFFVITNRELRARLVEHSAKQPQVTDASHLVVFTAKTKITITDIDEYAHRTAEVRGVELSSLDTYRHHLISSLIEGPESKNIFQWTSRQAFIALGNFLASAALLGVDACPMGGINPAGYDAVLGLEELGLQTLVIATAGYRHPEDKYGHLKKVRFETDEVVVHLA